MFSILIFLLAIIVANLLTQWQGPWITPVNAFVLIGLDLSLRDRIHEKWHGNYLGPKMLGLICAGAAITYLLNRGAGMICIGSVVAFAGALIVDSVVYQKLMHKSKLFRMNGSNVPSAITDSILFPTIAFGVFMPWVIIFQAFAKIGGGALWAWILTRKEDKCIT